MTAPKAKACGVSNCIVSKRVFFWTRKKQYKRKKKETGRKGKKKENKSGE